MTLLSFDEHALIEKLNTLPKRTRVAFAASCAQRMSVTYEIFTRISGEGDSASFTDLLNCLWDDLGGTIIPNELINDKRESCMELIPQEDTTWINEQASADDAASALT